MNSLKILTIALDHQVESSLKTKFATKGLETESVESFFEGLSLLEAQPSGTFGCLLLDLDALSIDPYEAIQQFRLQQIEIPIICLTANCLSSGDFTSDGLVTFNNHWKPVYHDRLVKSVTHAIEHSRRLQQKSEEDLGLHEFNRDDEASLRARSILKRIYRLKEERRLIHEVVSINAERLKII